MPTVFKAFAQKHRSSLFLIAVLLFVNLYSLSTLTTKPAYWYDEAINVELARNFRDSGRLDLIVAPHVFSGAGATVGSTGYPVTVPLAAFFKLFGFGLAQARAYMLLWMNAFLLVFFFVARRLWGLFVAYGGITLLASFAPFYGNGRSVMGEIPGFLFFLLSFHFLETRRYLLSGALLGLSVISKPSVFVFLIPAYAFALLLRREEWRERLRRLVMLGAGSFLALLPWLALYADEMLRGGLTENIFRHFSNPYAEAGVSAATNIARNLGTLFQSTTLLYFTVLLVLVAAALHLNRELLREQRTIVLLSAVYLPLALLQYLKSLGYLRYLIASEFMLFVLFLIVFPILLRRLVDWVCHSRPLRQSASEASASGNPEKIRNRIPVFTGMTVAVLTVIQLVHLFWFSNLYASERAHKTLAYLSSAYPTEIIGVYNAPQIGSLLPADRKYQYLSTYGLWRFGINPLLLPKEVMPPVLVVESGERGLSSAEQELLSLRYEKDAAFTDGFAVYKKK